ncbi:hypothetical protein [Altericroceibacterium xinjiangense]|uniref:hypothetical protein n=1 Tax=Altericroceibacterium xinjiangense TaxID=762261 RepID=UPI000F7D9B95|nr:hypothetical protein [Altericroceibacterium xinjiangense]
MAEIRTTHTDGTLVSATEAPALLKRVSWGAIFAGAFIALGVTFLLGLLGLAIGFGSIEPTTSSPLDGIGIGAGIWWVVTSIIAMGIGGWVAGRLSGIPNKPSATAHGATVWALVTIFTLWMATSAVGSVLNTATGAVSGAARGVLNVGQVAANASGPVDVNQQQISNQIDQVRSQVEAQVENVDTAQLRSDATQAADTAVEALSTAAWYAFFSSLLAFAAAVIGAGMGAPHHTYVAGREDRDDRT